MELLDTTAASQWQCALQHLIKKGIWPEGGYTMSLRLAESNMQHASCPPDAQHWPGHMPHSLGLLPGACGHRQPRGHSPQEAGWDPQRGPWEAGEAVGPVQEVGGGALGSSSSMSSSPAPACPWREATQQDIGISSVKAMLHGIWRHQHRPLVSDWPQSVSGTCIWLESVQVVKLYIPMITGRGAEWRPEIGRKQLGRLEWHNMRGILLNRVMVASDLVEQVASLAYHLAAQSTSLVIAERHCEALLPVCSRCQHLQICRSPLPP